MSETGAAMNFFGGNSFLIFAITAFVAVVLLVEALYLMWNSYKGPEAKKIEQRLRALSAGADASPRAIVLKNRMLSSAPAVERLLLAVPRVQALDRALLQSGLDWTVAKFVTVSLICAAGTFLLIASTHVAPLLELPAALAAAAVPATYIVWMRRRRLRRMEQQLPDALDLIGRAMRAGHALPSGLQMAGEEMAEPIGTEFRVTHDEINFGVSLQQALVNLSERVPITDLRYFVVAVVVQREAGGNLTEVLDNLSKLIRARLKFHSRIKVLTTEGRLSAWVLCLIPFVLAGILNLVNHEFISVLWTDPIGIAITQVVLTMMAAGAIWMYKLVRLRV